MVLHNRNGGGGKHSLVQCSHAGLAKDNRVRFADAMSCKRRTLVSLMLLVPVAVLPAQARDTLGIFEGWGTFRDPAVPRCYAIARPVSPRGSAGKGFAAVSTWPRQRVRGQVHFRLSRTRAPQAAVTLNVGDRRFTLVAGKADAWAADSRGDAAIVAAMRSGSSMSVQTTGVSGHGFADTYTLRGAATAIDAAALGCARVR